MREKDGEEEKSITNQVEGSVTIFKSSLFPCKRTIK